MAKTGDIVRVNSGRWVDHYGRKGIVVNTRNDGERGGLLQVCVEFDQRVQDRHGDVLWIDDVQVSQDSNR